MKKDKLLNAILREVLADYASDNVYEMMEIYGDDKDSFCDRFELGNWVYDLFDLSDTELSEHLNAIYESKRADEDDDLKEYQMLMADLMKSQGYDD